RRSPPGADRGCRRPARVRGHPGRAAPRLVSATAEEDPLLQRAPEARGGGRIASARRRGTGGVDAESAPRWVTLPYVGGPIVARLQAFGPYDLIERVSVGSTGEVFRAVRRGEGRVVALKRLMPSASRDRRLVASHEREAVIARALDHPSIVKVLDSGV